MQRCRRVRILLFPVLHVHAGDRDERVCPGSVLLRPHVRDRHAHQSTQHVWYQGRYLITTPLIVFAFLTIHVDTESREQDFDGILARIILVTSEQLTG